MIKRKKHLFWNTKYLVTTAVITALLFVLALITSFIKLGTSSFQIADGLFLSLIPIIPGPMMLICGLIYPTLFDLITGSFIFIPCSILLHLMMFFIVRYAQKWISIYLILVLASLMIFGYVPYNYLINLNLGPKTAQAIAIKELIVDTIQWSLTLVISLITTYIFGRYHFNLYLRQKIQEYQN